MLRTTSGLRRTPSCGDRRLRSSSAASATFGTLSGSGPLGLLFLHERIEAAAAGSLGLFLLLVHERVEAAAAPSAKPTATQRRQVAEGSPTASRKIGEVAEHGTTPDPRRPRSVVVLVGCVGCRGN